MVTKFFQILSPMRNNSMRATHTDEDGRYLLDIEDSSEEATPSGGWQTVWMNVDTGAFETSDKRDLYWVGFVKGVELMDHNATVREVESFDEDAAILFD
jgi:hypothetical protein